VFAVHVWRLTPLSAVIILAGLVAIPKDIEEAARVDGAGFWRRSSR
jgi:multiple sugar transport system permease protein